MPLKPAPVPCPAGTHRAHPHSHGRVELEGRVYDKPCNGRFWCTVCRDWFTKATCVLPRPLKLPAGWTG